MLKRSYFSIPAALCAATVMMIGGCNDTDPVATAEPAATETQPPAADSAAEASASEASATADESDGSFSNPEASPTLATNIQRDTTANRREAATQEVTADRSGTPERTRPRTDAEFRGPVRVVAEPAVLDLGDMATGETKAGTVTLRNTGEEPMKVVDSRTSCGCTVANVPKGQELQPGESVDVEVSLRGGNRPDRLSKTVTFRIENQDPVIVRVQGNTIAYVTIEPAVIDPDNLPDDQVVVSAGDDQPFSITSVHPAIVETLPSEPATEHRLTLSWDRWEEQGKPRRLLIYIDHPKTAQITSAIRVPATPMRTAADAESRSRPARSVRQTPETLIAQGNTEDFLAQLGEEVFEVDATDRTDTTLLGIAAKHGNVEIMQALIDAGADIEATDRQGGTPLMHAARSKNAEAVRLLIQAGADVDRRDTTLANTALSWAAGFGDSASVRELIDAGAQVEIVSTATGFTPLILAAGFGEADSVKHLIDAGAEVDAVDTLQGFTAAMYAASTGKADNIRVLAERNANLETTDPAGRTVLLIAAGAASAKSDIIKTLLDAGADATVLDREGKNALEHAKGRTDPNRDEVVAALEAVVVASSD